MQDRCLFGSVKQFTTPKVPSAKYVSNSAHKWCMHTYTKYVYTYTSFMYGSFFAGRAHCALRLNVSAGASFDSQCKV